jgi:hypothetical protein
VSVWGAPAWPEWPEVSDLLSNFKPVMLSVKQFVNRPDYIPDLVSVT